MDMKNLILLVFLISTIPTQGQKLFLNERVCLPNIEADSNFIQLFDTTQVVLVSFKFNLSTREALESIAQKKKKLNQTLLKEAIVLDLNQKTSLKQLFTSFRGNSTGGKSKSKCLYSPRNGIFFLNKEGNVLAYLEICFQCLDSYVFPQGVGEKLSPRCDKIYSALNIFMAEQGITHGTWSKEVVEMMKMKLKH